MLAERNSQSMGFRRAKLLSPKAVVGISVLCMLALLPDPLSLLSDHVDAALRESAKGHCEGDGS